MASSFLKRAFSFCAAAPLALATPYYAYYGVDEGIYGAEENMRGEVPELSKQESARLMSRIGEAKTLIQQGNNLEEKRKNVFIQAVKSGHSRSEANAMIKTISFNIDDIENKLRQSDDDFSAAIYSNTTVSEAFLQKAIENYRQVRPEIRLDEDQARHLNECQVKYNLNSIYNEFDKSEINKVKICTETRSGINFSDIMAVGAGLFGIFGGMLVFLLTYTAVGAGYQRIENAAKGTPLGKPKLKKPDN